MGTLSGTSALLSKSIASKRNGINDSAKKEDNDHDKSDMDMDMDVDNEKVQSDDLEDGEEIEEEDHVDVRIMMTLLMALFSSLIWLNQYRKVLRQRYPS